MGTIVMGLMLLGVVPGCGEVRCGGKRISSDLDLISFCVPRGMRVESATGEHGDVHHTVRYRRYTLRMVSGPHYSAKRQEEFGAEWEVRSWESPHGERKEYRRDAGGLRSRYMTLAPNGWVPGTNLMIWAGVLGICPRKRAPERGFMPFGALERLNWCLAPISFRR